MRRVTDPGDLPSGDIAIREIHGTEWGEPNTPPPRRRWPAALVTAVLVLVLARLAAGQQHTDQPVEQAPSVAAQTPRSVAPTAASTSNATSIVDPLSIPLLNARSGSAPAGLRLLTNDPVPGILDLDTGRRTRLTGLSSVDQHQTPRLTALPGGDVVLVYPDPAGSSGRAYLADQQGRARLIGVGAVALPGADGSILLSRFATVASTDPTWPLQTLTAIDRHGNELWSYPVPGNSVALAGTERGVLLAVYHPDGITAQIVLLDPDTGRLRELGTGSSGLTADDQHALWLSTGCSQQPATHCLLMVTDLVTGTSRSWPVSGNGPSFGLIAPDGRSVALAWYTTFSADGSSAQPGHLDILDLATGRSSRAAGVAPAVKRLPSLAWLPDNRTLLLALAWPDHWRIAWWQGGGSRPTSWPVSLPATEDDQQLLFLPR
ncbi:MAG TPA: hypothetical protein VJ851_10695 [Jatrophihabitans sp.]|nr:hypothetical protein [Jatrophihabitans sp.]